MPSTTLLRDVAAVLVLEPPETQRVGDADHLGAHAQHVAHDPADAGRRAFERHDLRGMVVRLVRDDDAVRLAVPLAEPQRCPRLPPTPSITVGPSRRQLAQSARAIDLYEQCSLHCASNANSSVGGRHAPEMLGDRAQTRRRRARRRAGGRARSRRRARAAVYASAMPGGRRRRRVQLRVRRERLRCAHSPATSSTRPNTTVSSSANAFAHAQRDVGRDAVGGVDARTTGFARGVLEHRRRARCSPEPTATNTMRANVASSWRDELQHVARRPRDRDDVTHRRQAEGPSARAATSTPPTILRAVDDASPPSRGASAETCRRCRRPVRSSRESRSRSAGVTVSRLR